jgi:ActR/RegA family two-component response regulator
MTSDSRTPSSAPVERLHGRSVLVVTDMAFQAQELERVLTEFGMSPIVVLTADGHLRAASLDCDVAVLDMDLGLGTVEPLISQLRTRRPEVLICLMLGWWDAREDDARRYAASVIRKPVDQLQVRATLGIPQGETSLRALAGGNGPRAA